MTRRAKWILGLLSCAAIASVVYVAAPYYALRRLATGLATHDAALVAEWVDFERLRTNLKQHLRESYPATENPLAMLAGGLARGATDSLVDLLVTPTTLDQVLAGARLLPGAGRGSGAASDLSAVFGAAKASFVSLTEFSVGLEPMPNASVELRLERQGLRWRVVDLRLP